MNQGHGFERQVSALSLLCLVEEEEIHYADSDQQSIK